MGIPDTFFMPIYDTQIFTAEETSSSNSSTQEYMPPCTQVFCKVLFNYNKDNQTGPSLFRNGDSSSVLLTCKDIKKAANIKKFTLSEIKAATGNYSKQNIIGEGGCGIVYKGILPGNQLIAVKRPRQKSSSMHIIEQLVNEINVLSQIDSKNAVKLLGCCFERKVPSIVYEYITNGTLHDHLFDERKSCLLTWNHRLRIGLQVAQVLAYLHTIPIIHRDIKPMNILLDHNYTAKLSDFGISRFAAGQDEFITLVEDKWTRYGYSTRLIGTYGYLDPEYISTGRITKGTDVYSFGVVLAELLASKKAICDLWKAEGYLTSRTTTTIPHEQSYLASIFLEKLNNYSLLEILDKQLVNEGSMEQLMEVAHLAARCLELKCEDRPTMSQVVRELQYIGGF